MAIVKCANNHFYDNNKNGECPYCKKLAENPDAQNPAEQWYSNRGPVGRTAASDGPQKTVAVFFQNKHINPVSGWIVCIDGENKGRSFEVHVGKNFVGRSMKMDINTNDESISRDNHFSIVYEPVKSVFYLVPGNGVTYHNDQILSVAEVLTEGDTIGAGKSKYTFVPYCKEGRGWNV